MSQSLLSSLSFLGVSVGAGGVLLASGSGRVARLAQARRVLLASGWLVRVGPAWRFGAAGGAVGLRQPVVVAVLPSLVSQVSSLAH